jgi:hypothetical protein
MVIITDGTSIKFERAATPPEDTIPKITITTPRPKPIKEAISKTLSPPHQINLFTCFKCKNPEKFV